jgi:hypothetical protein
MTVKKITEVKLAEPIVAYLENSGYDVYQEVKVHGGCADIIAVKDGEVTVVEVKTSLTISLLHQAHGWNAWANRIYIAVPYTRDKARYFAYRVCRDYGLGVLLVNKKTMGVREEVSTSLHRKTASKKILAALRPEHKTYCKAGTHLGKRFTPFQETCDALKLLVKQKPGLSLDEAVKQIKHHYKTNASAKFSLAKWLKKGVVKGLKIEKGKLYLV